MERFTGLFITVLIFGVLNAVLYFGQESYHSADVSRSLVLEKEIDVQKRQFILLEFQLKNIEEKANEVTNKEEWDQLNIKYTQLKQEYDNIFESHNENVKVYNKLIKSCGSRWYIIPIPRMGRGKTHN